MIVLKWVNVFFIFLRQNHERAPKKKQHQGAQAEPFPSAGRLRGGQLQRFSARRTTRNPPQHLLGQPDREALPQVPPLHQQEDYAELDPHQESPQQHPHATQSFRNTNAPTRAADRRSNNNDPTTGQPNKKGADPRRTAAEDGGRQGQKPGEKKKGESGKQTGSHSMGFQQDLGGSATVGQRQRLPPAESIALISQAAIRASMQKALLQKNGELKGDRKKKGSNGLDPKSQRQQLKPFKRQSYHVAIAYHIHLKRVKPNENSNANDIDPTYNARKLREQQEKQQ